MMIAMVPQGKLAEKGEEEPDLEPEPRKLMRHGRTYLCSRPKKTSPSAKNGAID